MSLYTISRHSESDIWTAGFQQKWYIGILNQLCGMWFLSYFFIALVIFFVLILVLGHSLLFDPFLFSHVCVLNNFLSLFSHLDNSFCTVFVILEKLRLSTLSSWILFFWCSLIHSLNRRFFGFSLSIRPSVLSVRTFECIRFCSIGFFALCIRVTKRGKQIKPFHRD